jgi:hypothetical protein
MPVSYEHTQHSRGLLLLNCVVALVPIALLVTGVLARTPTPVQLTLLAVTVLSLGLAVAFSSLTVTVRDGQFSGWFGPGVIKRTVPLSAIAHVEPVTTTIWNGWGIHLTARGWLYNIAGRKAVFVTMRDGKRFLVGTDEPERLTAALLSSTGSSR